MGHDYELVSDVADNRTLATLTKAEIDTQIATAKQYPRSITNFIEECKTLVMISAPIARECMYVLNRKGRDNKMVTIEGPSSRLAEIVQSCWGNCRSGARIIAEERDFIVAQGVFHDLERNSLVTYEVKRRITKSDGGRFSTDMIGVTGNAACSIALRNAVFKGIPKAFWQDIYDTAKRTALGGEKSITERREGAITYWKEQGIDEEQLYRYLGIEGKDDIGLHELLQLIGLVTAIKEGDTTLEQAFSEDEPGLEQSQETESLNRNLKDAAEKKRQESIEKAEAENGDVVIEDNLDEQGSLFTIIDMKAKVDVIGSKLEKAAGKKPTKKELTTLLELIDEAEDILNDLSIEDDEKKVYLETLNAQREKANEYL